jgi:hypothetical protein
MDAAASEETSNSDVVTEFIASSWISWSETLMLSSSVFEPENFHISYTLSDPSQLLTE